MFRKTLLGIGAVIILAVAYYGLSPLLRNVRLEEEAPTATEQSATVPSATSTDNAIDNSPSNSTPVVGNTAHPASGNVRVINTEKGTVVRYENFKTINGPDLYIYLAKDLNAKEYISLGKLRATEGNVNYTIPEGVNINDYKYIMVWCKRFGVLFNYADLSAIRTAQ